MIRLALIRHGITPWNAAGRLQGRTDIALDPGARAHLQTRALPDPWDAAALWASPLSRAVETAALLAGRHPRIDPRLSEMNWGDWEGLDRAALARTAYRPVEEWGWGFRAPGGESPEDVRDRLMPWLEDLTGDALVVTHMGVMRVLLAMAHDWDFDGPMPFAVKRDRLFIVDWDGARLTPGDVQRLDQQEPDPCG